ncbi:hypothetical protein PoB_001845700 [Plakobranchus ocellatus]|uniref:Endonuclease/exonuclease/phosphatase domain-containing protein n=1 Tax=Plakobranchus ocellatus TaxID=259542 RepID=A0AAV3Z9P0_9GAST|nr:hypothetical protein PoB_001845700 [Plakobranchus ocellatus]
MGDYNVKVGNERIEHVWPSGIRTVNERGSRPIECRQINDFSITNIGIKTILDDSGFGKALAIEVEKIDYILIQKRFRNATKHQNHCREPTVIQIIFKSNKT